jgi:hypothetical protein
MEISCVRWASNRTWRERHNNVVEAPAAPAPSP